MTATLVRLDSRLRPPYKKKKKKSTKGTAIYGEQKKRRKTGLQDTAKGTEPSTRKNAVEKEVVIRLTNSAMSIVCITLVSLKGTMSSPSTVLEQK